MSECFSSLMSTFPRLCKHVLTVLYFKNPHLFLPGHLQPLETQLTMVQPLASLSSSLSVIPFGLSPFLCVSHPTLTTALYQGYYNGHTWLELRLGNSNQRTGQPTNKGKTRYLHQETPQISYHQMPRSKCKSTHMTQENMPAAEANNLIIKDPVKSNLDEA